MKGCTSDGLFRLAVIAAVVLAVLASLIQPVPSLLAWEEGDGYWTDLFNDATGISKSTDISVSGGDVRLDTTDIPAVAFSDSFEGNLSKWNNTNWYITSSQYHDGSQSVMSRNNNEGNLRVLNTIDLSDTNTAYLDFWYRHSATEANDFRLQLYNGASWITIANLGGGAHNTWLHYDNVDIDLGTYGISNFSFRFSSSPDDGNEYVWVDEITLVKTVAGPYSASGNLNSISMTPSNLQSWDTFTASDNTTCLSYRKPISITGTGTALTDYQVSVPVTYVSGKMNSDFSDLRFKDSSGNMLSYWVESYVASTSAQVWVKVPSIAASGTTTIYIYYGNAAASSASNGEDTFIFFDDFSGDLSKWTAYKNAANINIVGGYLECSGGFTTSPYGHTVLGSSASYTSFTDGIIDGKVYLDTDGIAEVGYRGNYAANTGYKSRMDARVDQGLGHLVPPYVDESWAFLVSGGGPTGTAIPTGNWYTFSIIASGSSLHISCAGQTLTGTDTSYMGSGEISLQNHYGAYSLFDDIRVRQYAATEPSIIFGGEQSGSYCGFINPGTVTSITYQILNAADESVLCTITAAQAAAGYDISSCAASASSIKLRAELSTSDTSQTPILYEWTVTWSSVIPVSIDITAPSDILSWNLDPDIGENTNSGTLSVDVTPYDTIWSVTAQDLDTTTAGFMTIWTGSEYGATQLVNAMRIQGPTAEVTLPNTGGIAIATGEGNTPNINITFKQLVTWDDEPGTYQIVVTFIGTVN